MLAVNAYYNGKDIVLEREVKMVKGQKMMVVFETVEEKPKRKFDLDKYGIPTERGEKVDEYMKEIRENDRL